MLYGSSEKTSCYSGQFSADSIYFNNCAKFIIYVQNKIMFLLCFNLEKCSRTNKVLFGHLSHTLNIHLFDLHYTIENQVAVIL